MWRYALETIIEHLLIKARDLVDFIVIVEADLALPPGLLQVEKSFVLVQVGGFGLWKLNAVAFLHACVVQASESG